MSAMHTVMLQINFTSDNDANRYITRLLNMYSKVIELNKVNTIKVDKVYIHPG